MPSLELLQLAEQSEEVVKKSAPATTPLMLLLTCSSLAIYVIFQVEDKLWLKSFLAMAALQILPLVVLKLKIWMCPDRLSLTPILLVKTLLMHLAAITIRVVMACLRKNGEIYVENQAFGGGIVRRLYNLGALIIGLTILCQVFGFKRSDIIKHVDVAVLVLLSFVLAAATAFITDIALPTPYLGHAFTSRWPELSNIRGILDDTGNFADILSFVPVAFLVCNENGVEHFTPGTTISPEGQRQALYFFGFIVAFYLEEDIIEPVAALTDFKGVKGYELTVMAHAAHFMMLLDFVGYFLFRILLPKTFGTDEKKTDLELVEQTGLLHCDSDDDV